MDPKEEAASSGSDEEEDEKGKGRKTRTFTKIKDVNKPKLPHTAYIMFLSDRSSPSHSVSSDAAPSEGKVRMCGIPS